MKITIIGPVYPYRGGIAHFTSQLSQELRATGHDLQVITFKRQYPAFLYPGRTDKDPSIAPISTQAEAILDPFYPWTWLTAVREIKSHNPDIVIINWWTTFWAPAYACIAKRLIKNGIKVAYLIHNVLPHEERIGDRTLAKLALKQAGGHIVMAEEQSQKLKSLLPDSKPVISALPVFSMFSSSVTQEAAREALGLPQDKPILLFFGIVRPYKGLDLLLDAIAREDVQVFNPLLLISGEFWQDKEAAQQKLRLLGIEDSVIIDDRYISNEELPALFNASDFFVAPYISATQSGAVKLAMGFHLPMIISGEVASGLTEEQLENAIVVEELNPVGLSNAIVDMITKSPTRSIPIEPENGWSIITDTILGMVEK